MLRVVRLARVDLAPPSPARLPPSVIAAARADCGMLAQVGSAQPVAEGAAEVATLGRLAALSWLGCSGRPARRWWPPTTASTTPPCRLDCCWHDPNQAWSCVCAGRLVRRRWFCSKPPSPSLTLPLAVPLRPPAEPEASEDEYEYCRGSRPRQPFASRSPSPCRYPTVSPRNTTSAQELGFRARGFTQTSQSWSGSRMLGEPGLDQRNLWLGSHNLG